MITRGTCGEPGARSSRRQPCPRSGRPAWRPRPPAPAIQDPEPDPRGSFTRNPHSKSRSLASPYTRVRNRKERGPPRRVHRQPRPRRPRPPSVARPQPSVPPARPRTARRAPGGSGRGAPWPARRLSRRVPVSRYRGRAAPRAAHEVLEGLELLVGHERRQVQGRKPGLRWARVAVLDCHRLSCT